MQQQVPAQRQLRDWTVTGLMTSAGATYRKVTIRGEATVTGNLECETLKVLGTLVVHGSLAAKEAKITGTLEIDGGVTSDSMRITGELTADGDCSMEALAVKGAVQIGGLLNAGVMDLVLYGPSHAREIGGDSITVKPRSKYMPMGGAGSRLVVDAIEGDDIKLQNTSAKVVRGNRVNAGQGCDIESVEYRSSYDEGRGAKVAKKTKL